MRWVLLVLVFPTPMPDLNPNLQIQKMIGYWRVWVASLQLVVAASLVEAQVPFGVELPLEELVEVPFVPVGAEAA